MDDKQCAEVAKALGDDTRLRIFNMLREREMCACKILENLHCTQPTLSYHMKSLCGSDLVTARKVGTWSHYSIDLTVLDAFLTRIGEGDTQI